MGATLRNWFDSLDVGEGTNLSRIKESFLDEISLYPGTSPTFLGYQDYPAPLCLSLNEVVLYGLPRPNTLLGFGDVLRIDAGLTYEGLTVDSARTFVIGRNIEAEKALKIAKSAVYCGINQAIPGKTIGDISHAIQSHIEWKGYQPCLEIRGHGTGRALHLPPGIPNYGIPHSGPVIEEGMVLAIEPVISKGVPKLAKLDDGWQLVNYNQGVIAHWEHTIYVDKDEPEVLT